MWEISSYFSTSKVPKKVPKRQVICGFLKVVLQALNMGLTAIPGAKH